MFDFWETDGNGIRRRVQIDGESVTETISDDVEPVIEHNKALQNEGDGFSPTREMRRIASIPMALALKWKFERGVDVFNPDHAPAVRALLNDPEYRYLRTSPGRF
jgi:hypothetical protein